MFCSAKPLSELLVTSNHTSWLELLNKAGLLEDLNKQENITMFVPTERVLTDEKVKAQLAEMDADTLRQVSTDCSNQPEHFGNSRKC